ncbi:MAG: 5-formyltetrahydrofolate cyclo-ligase [Clostridia bacterium]|nr:5-formyltetrahydrofolate cyclo-ligase [Clostridia bacterium]
MLSFQTEKNEVRALLKNRRSALSDDAIKASSEKICENTLKQILDIGATNVLMFSPIKKEPDLDKLALRLLELGLGVFYPISHTDVLNLTFHKITSLGELKVSTYGIKEPPEDFAKYAGCPTTVCLVPALAFDSFGARIGYGKGYYDRFLSDFCGKSFGIVFHDLFLDKLPTDEHDIPVDLIITEQGVVFQNEAKKGFKV